MLGLALYGPQAASHRVRLAQYVQGLAEIGIELKIHSLLDDAYVRSRFEGRALPLASILSSAWRRFRLLMRNQSFDAAIVHCELFPLFPGWLERALLKIPYVYDFDDAFFLRYRTGRLAGLRHLLGDKFDTVIRSAAVVTAGNQFLREYASGLNVNVVQLPSVVDTSAYRPMTKSFCSNQFTIGWVGSPSTAVYLDQMVVPLATLAAEAPIRFVVIGGKAPSIPGVEILELPWIADNEVELINEFDVGVMPLPNDEWAKGKCAFKLIQYMACGVPVVASRVGANADVVSDECGFLADDEDCWTTALRLLRDRPDLRVQMGAAARQRAVAEYSIERNLPVLADVIRKVVAKG
ncbi:MAG: glycosyltransferase family 4 protein [Fluviibacter sp.]